MRELYWPGIIVFLLVDVICLLTEVCCEPEIRVIEPEFSPVPDTLTYREGETAKLLCTVKHLGERTVTWRRLPDPNPLTIGLTTWVDDSRIMVEHVVSQDQWNLVIYDVMKQDAGTYECQVHMRHKKLRQHVVLSIKDEPVKRYPEILISGRQVITSGEEVSLTCNATVIGNGDNRLEWFKDGSRITTEDSRIVLDFYKSQNNKRMSSALTIKLATVDDAGTYVCRSSELPQMTSTQISVYNAGSNNVKRAGSISLPTAGVTRITGDLSQFALIMFMVFVSLQLT